MQTAFRHSAGAFCALLTLKRNGTTDRAALAACAQLLRNFEAANRSPDNLFLLMGFGGAFLDAIVANPNTVNAVASRFPSHAELNAASADRIALSQAAELRPDVCIQIAAQTEIDRVHALRCTSELLSAHFTITEILGGRVRSGEDPLGFRSGGGDQWAEGNPATFATPAGSAWLYVSHFDLKVKEFFQTHNTEHKRAQAMARPPALVPPTAQLGKPIDKASRGLAHAQAPERRDLLKPQVDKHPSGHAFRMLAHKTTILRRGFTCRVESKEGLAFLAAAPALAPIRAAVAHFAPGDDIQPFAVESRRSCFFVPTDADFATGVAAWQVPDYCREVQNPIELEIYEVGMDEAAYIKALLRAMVFGPRPYGGQSLKPNYAGLFGALDALITVDGGGNVAALSKMRADLMASANVMNGWIDDYFCKG